MPTDEPASPSLEGEDSRASSAGSWAAGSNPFVGNRGPAFDPDGAEETPATPLRVVDVRWEPARIRTALRAQGILTHEAIGVGIDDWAWRDSELDAGAEPIANTLNKIPMLRAAAAVSDELTAGAVLIEYAARSIKERAQVIREQKRRAQTRRPAQPEPITGVDAAGERVTDVTPDEVAWETPE